MADGTVPTQCGVPVQGDRYRPACQASAQHTASPLGTSSVTATVTVPSQVPSLASTPGDSPKPSRDPSPELHPPRGQAGGGMPGQGRVTHNDNN